MLTLYTAGFWGVDSRVSLKMEKSTNIKYQLGNDVSMSSLTSADYVRCQMSVMTDDGHKSHQYGCLQKRLCKCSN